LSQSNAHREQIVLRRVTIIGEVIRNRDQFAKLTTALKSKRQSQFGKSGNNYPRSVMLGGDESISGRSRRVHFYIGCADSSRSIYLMPVALLPLQLLIVGKPRGLCDQHGFCDFAWHYMPRLRAE
jgi:hypothetical protein